MTLRTVEKPDYSARDEIDRMLLRRISRGDRDAFDALYFDYHRRLSKFLLRFTSQYTIVEEVINDTMFCVWKQVNDYQGQSRVSTWIMAIAFRQARDVLRGLKRARIREQRVFEEQQLTAELSTDDDRIARSEWIAAALEELPVEQRVAVELAYVFGHSTSEIAEICDCPVNTVKSRMFAARKALRVLLRHLSGESRDTRLGSQ